MQSNTRKILALDPGTRHAGIAVFVGSELRYYAVRDFHIWRSRNEMLTATRRFVGGFIDGYAPDVIAYEGSPFTRPPRRSALLCDQEAEIRRLGLARGVRVMRYTPVVVREGLCGNAWAEKREVASRLVERYPELARYRAMPGTLRERYWSHLFDAVAVGAVCLDGVKTASQFWSAERTSRVKRARTSS